MAVALWTARDRGMLKATLRLPEFIALPLVAWVVRRQFFTPQGIYAEHGYNEFVSLREIPAGLLKVPGQVLIQPLAHAAQVAGWVGLAVAVIAAVVVFAHRTATEPSEATEQPAPTHALWLVAAGLLVLAAGAFPYLAVGKAPVLEGWQSRHQLLAPIGGAILVAAVARIRVVGLTLVAILIGVVMVADARMMLIHQRAWHKQLAMVSWASESADVRRAKHIEVIDAAPELNPLGAMYTFYELAGMFTEATGTRQRMVSRPGQNPLPTGSPCSWNGPHTTSPGTSTVRIVQ